MRTSPYLKEMEVEPYHQWQNTNYYYNYLGVSQLQGTDNNIIKDEMKSRLNEIKIKQS